jgi:hypothetical protein
VQLSVSKEFSETPGPRDRSEGAYSGEQFLEELLRPAFMKALAAKERLFIDLDGTEGYATSFLEAAFGGLARLYSAEQIFGVLEFKSEDEPYLLDEIKQYIKDAKPQ